MPHARIQSCSVFIAANWYRRAWGRRVWPWLASSESDCGSCCGIRLSTTSSVVVDRSSRKAVMPVRGCQKRRMVRKVTGRLQRFYRRKLVQKGLGKASVAVARKLGIRLWIMLRDQIEYNEFCRRGQKQQKSSDACAGMPETRYGAKSHRPVD